MSSSVSNKKIGFLEIIVLFLSIYLLVAMLVDYLFKLPTEVSVLLGYFDNIICVFFLVEFLINFFRAENKIQFMKWGWVDLLASIPNVNVLRYGRVFRLIRLLRIIKAFKTVKKFLGHVFENRIQGTFTTVILLAILTIIFSSIAILQFEDDPNSNIKTAEDAIWWAYVTITTVGYGDKYPVTIEGRIIAIFLMTVGVGVFGTFTGFISSLLIKDRAKKEGDNHLD
jgi:voltage-gated potassium channel